MSDLISRAGLFNRLATVQTLAEAYAVIQDMPAEPPNVRCIANVTFDEEKLKEIVDEAIIRCKDCEYWRPHHQLGFDEDNDEYHDYCERLIPDDEFYAFYRNADDFCSRAKRRGNG